MSAAAIVRTPAKRRDPVAAPRIIRTPARRRAPLRLVRPGATADAPWGRRPYVVHGIAYPSLDALSAAIAHHRRLAGLDVAFTDPLIAEVVNTMHPDVVRRG